MTPEGLTLSAETEAPVNPFPGLRPFEFDESHLYFGRDGQSDRLIRKLAATRFVAVVGTSGSGKSSLVRAGLLPDLHGGLMSSAGSRWRVALLRPGNDPLGNLARALNEEEVFGSDIEENARIQTAITEATLRRGGLGLVEAVAQNRMPANENLLVVVDQFEELFRFARVSGSEQYRYEAAAFVKLLLEAARQRVHAVYVVITMRSDFLGDCSQFWDLPEAINEGQYLIPRMTRDQREEAINGPVAVCGGRVAQRLVNRLLNDVGDNPDQLPILQHALMRTWERWKDDHAEGEPLDLRHYESIGTMAEALSLHADEAFAELTDGRRLLAEKFFKALTEKGEDNREVRRPTVLGDLCALLGASQEEAAGVLEVFRREGRSFLTPSAAVPLAADSLIDISHESLIRNWKRLKEWVDEESQSAQIYTRLAETAVLYERGQAGLWRDPDLQLALDWREQSRPTAAWGLRYHPAFDSARSFLDASVAARDAALLAEEQKRRREIRRARATAVVFFLLFMLSLVASAFAYNQSLQARAALDEAREANAQAQTARERAVAERDRANQQSDIARSNEQKAKDAEGVALEKQKEAEASKAEAEKQAGIAQQNFHQAEVARLEADKQRKTAEGEATRNRQLLYASDMTLAQQAYDNANVTRARAILDSHRPGAGERPGFEWYYLWRLLNGAAATLDTGGVIYEAAVSGDGKTLAVSKGGVIELWDMASRRKLKAIEVGAKQASALALSPDGRYLAFGRINEQGAMLADLAGGGEPVALKKLTESGRESTTIAFSPDSKTLAVGSPDSKIELWDVASREKKTDVSGTEGVSFLAFSPDGTSMVIVQRSGWIEVYDVTANKIIVVKQVGGFAGSIAFTPDGKMFAVGFDDGLVRFFRTETLDGSEIEFDGKGSSPVNSIAVSPDGYMLALGFADNNIRVLQIRYKRHTKLIDAAPQKLRVLATLKGRDKLPGRLAFLPGSQRLLSGSRDGTIELWDTASQIKEQGTFYDQYSPLNVVAFSPDGQRLADGDDEGFCLLFDVGTGKELNGSNLKSPVRSLAFSPDGRRLLVGSDKPPADTFDPEMLGFDLTTPATASSPVRAAAYSPDGRWFVTGSPGDHTVRLWDASSKRMVGERKFDRSVLSVAFSPDGRMIAAGLGNGTVELWDSTLTNRLASLTEKEVSGDNAAYCLAFSPDGSVLAAGLDNGDVKLIDPAGRKELAQRLRGHNGAIFSVAFSPDGGTLATGDFNAKIKLWGTRSSKELMTLNGHDGAVMSLAFSPDGRTLASGSFDRTVRLWRAASDEEVRARSR